MLHVSKFTGWSLLENHNSDKIDAIKGILKIKAKFTVCSRCGNQLHHNLTTCSRCGKKNSRNDGATVEQILYRLKYRDLHHYPTMLTPELFYSSYENRLKDAGVSEEDFVQYVKDII